MGTTGTKKRGRPAGSTNKKNSSGRTSSSKKSEPKITKEQLEKKKRVRDEIWAIVIIAIGAFLAVAIQTKAAGQLGIVIGMFFKGCFGSAAYILPYYLIAYGLLLFVKKTAHITGRSLFFLFVIFLCISILNSARFIGADVTFTLSFELLKDLFNTGVVLESGGLFGMTVGIILEKVIGMVGLYIFTIVLIIVSLILVINTPVSQFFDAWRTKRQVAAAIAAEEEAAAEAYAEEQAHMAENAVDAESALSTEGAFVGMVSTPAEKTVKKEKGFLRRIFGNYFGSDENSSYEGVQQTEENKEYPSLLSGAPIKPLGSSAGLSVNTDAVPNDAAVAPIYSSSVERFSEEDLSTSLTGIDMDTGEILNQKLDLSKIKDNKDLRDLDKEYYKDNQKKILDYVRDDNLFESEAERLREEGMIGKTAEDAISVESDLDISSGKIQSESKPHGAETKIIGKNPVDTSAIANELSDAVENKIKYVLPTVDLLKKNTASADGKNTPDLQSGAALLEQTLQNFNVSAKVVKVTKGPAVTRYEIQPDVGVKVSSIVRLVDDIALSLAAKSIRIEAPIPGKSAVGIEIENDKVQMVVLREILESTEFKNSKSKISFSVGKDISGTPIVCDLKDMPHLLIAGSTGSGKSVCINSLIMSILYKAMPDEVKLMLIDPKVVELNNFNGIPHLMVPVVTEPGKAAAALNWAVAEMNNRYRRFAEKAVRDLAGYNEKLKKEGEDLLPQIVIIIDELADLMMAAPSQVEEAICRLAQMARAAGLHLIVATQRPSVDVITGVIKANIPSRIAFAVSSQFDSRTILDMAGAEKLVGKGDMLFNPQGKSKPIRVQGAFISDDEVSKVIDFWKSQGTGVTYSEDVINSIETPKSVAADNDGDELLSQAIETVVMAEQASASMLQRRFRIGYNRAARLVDMMEERGIIGPQDGSRARKVLVSKEEFALWETGETVLGQVSIDQSSSKESSTDSGGGNKADGFDIDELEQKLDDSTI